MIPWGIKITICRRRKEESSRIVLQNKYNHNQDGVLLHRKVKIVAKSYNQNPGVDFRETFASMVRLSSIRRVIALAVAYGMSVRQTHVKTAYLNGKLEEKVSMEIPEA